MGATDRDIAQAKEFIAPPEYQRHRPETTLLYQLVAEHYPGFRDRRAADLLAYSDHVVAYVFTPVDPGNCICEIYWLVRNDANAGEDFDVDKLVWLWDVTTEADKTITVNNAKDVHSRFYQPGPFSEMEVAERNYFEWLLREMQRPL